ncbi:hypothetical protein NliqN6_5228 [Naganishia liquefaciens]|uniref:Protein YIF1 n=1 Tax=Naganishia liquefaciens TaxID=104408 RepID=A0A8H3YIR1_9TREE|nr:hypothetical protein NliqN6_5228 [Naganishia liquefaciens]
MSAPYTSARSPPPLVHPRPSHISQPPPEPRSSTSIDGSRPSGETYSRFSSPPPVVGGGDQGGYAYGGQGNTFSMMGDGGTTHQQQQQQQYGSGPRTGPYASSLGQQGGYMSPMGGAAAGGGGFNAFSAGGGQWPMGMNDATAQMGMQFGKSAVAAGQDYVEKNFSRFLPLPLLKTSFSVTNSYVLHKLRLILFPWRHRPWSRLAVRTSRASGPDGVAVAGQDGWMPPRDDINAPDLYIPTMALVTYVLLSGLASGLQNRFHPEVLGYTFSKALGVVLTEFTIIKLGCYLLDVRGTGASGVELIGYGGYKFVGIIVTVIASFLNWGKIFYFSVFFYTFCANAFFLLRSLKYVLLPDSSNSSSVATISHSSRSKRVQFLFVIAMAQFLFMGLLARV